MDQQDLQKEEFIRVKEEVRNAWRVLGQLQLRMTNDLNLNIKKRLSAEIIQKRLDEARIYLDAAEEILK